MVLTTVKAEKKMAKKQIMSLLLRISVITLVLVLLVAAAGCASSTTVEPPVAAEPVEATDTSENPATTEVAEVPEEVEPDEGSEEQHEDNEQNEDTEEAEETEPDEDPESSEDDESAASSEQTPTAAELGLMVLEEGIKAPVFTLPTLEGSEVTLSDLQGKYVVLNFWSTNCPPCVAEMEYFETVGKQHPDDLAILTVDIRESDSKVSGFFGGGERSFIVALDKTGEVTSAYGIRYTPTTFFMDTIGDVYYARVGAFASQQQFEDSVALLLNK